MKTPADTTPGHDVDFGRIVLFGAFVCASAFAVVRPGSAIFVVAALALGCVVLEALRGRNGDASGRRGRRGRH